MSKPEQRANFGTLGRVAKAKIRNNNDLKVLVVASNSQTGVGKTTFAIEFCRYIDPEWSADEKAFVDVHEYIQAHKHAEKGSALLLDEIEAGADNRRAMSNENVELSKAWATLRARNMVTVCTLPSVSMLDKRMLEMADYQVFVKRRGLAQPYKVNVNDFAPNRLPSRDALPGEECIRFPELPENDPDKSYLDEIKRTINFGEDKEWVDPEDHQNALERAREDAAREQRNKDIRSVYETFDVSYRDLEEVDTFPAYRTIGDIVSEEK